ncbi:hypothetical protein [Shinella zoogloeoides]|uniref:hypothetical protein n=1 Tax=Shinella zoogloeoides TaxID=352475 RepID=UPI0028ACB06F|nr:hypothetical protein [Shinella zoogloeoides]
MAIAALAASIAGSGHALADPVYVWRPSEGLNGGQILPATAFATPPETGDGVDFRSEDYGSIPSYTTRTVALVAGDSLLIPIPSAFQIGQCQLLADDNGHRPDQWVTTSDSGGKYNVVIQARALGRLELTVSCVTNTGADVETLFHEYLNLTIS